MSGVAPHADASDPALVARVRAGEDAAFDELVARHQEKVYGIALRLTGNAADAEEILQDTFLAVYRKLSSFREQSKFTTWLYRVATNTALMHLRSGKRHQAEPLDQYLPQFDQSGHFIDATPVPRADDLVERKQLADQAMQAVERLAEPYRAVFVLRDVEDLSTQETAEILEIDPGVVRTRLHRARLMLRGWLHEVVRGET
jgi:RNA polymerase sigma-70 factor (ECF subfamily)